MIEFKSPSAEQTKIMQNFSILMGQVMELIIVHKESRHAHNAFLKAEECIQWFNSAIMNISGEVVDPLSPPPAAEVTPPAQEGEVILEGESAA